MKILLLNAPILTIPAPHIPPLGLCYIAAVLKNNNFKVDLIDLDLEREKFSNIREVIASIKPDMVGISGLTLQMNSVYAIAKIIKGISKDITVVNGGPHPSSLPEETLKESGGTIDVVVVGEGELTFLDIVKNKPWQDIEGIAYCKDNRIYKNKRRQLISDLDSLPFPARELLPLSRYQGQDPLKKTPMTHLVASRGCPFDCVFCSEAAVFGHIHRRRNFMSVVDEVECLINDYGMKGLSFYDDLFTLDKSWVISICKEIINRRITIDWQALSRVNSVDQEVLTWMKKAGCGMIFYGFESGSQQILDNIRKKQTIEQIMTAARLTKKAGIGIIGFFMIGNPGETQDTIYQTIKLARRIKPEHCEFTILRAEPGSHLYNQYIDTIRARRPSWDEYYSFTIDPNKMVTVGTDLSNQELIDFRRLAYIAMRPRSLVKHIIIAILKLDIKSIKQILKVLF
jgi:anaerobic magnesium-protoporphyrin IX monomethyl ester cyclase